MARIAGVDLPRDKRIEYGLTYIYGIGLHTSREILKKADVDPDITEERFLLTSRDSWRSDPTEASDTEEDSL